MSLLSVSLRVGVAVGGGYALTGAAVLALGAVLVVFGLPASEAVVVAGMTGFPVYLAFLLWGLACPSVTRLCGWTLGWTAVMGGLYLAVR